MPQPRQYGSPAERQAAYRKRCQEAIKQQQREKGLPALPSISTMAGTPRWRQAIASATSLLSMVVSQMEEYWSARSEAWRDGDRGESFQESLEAVSGARDLVADLTLP